MRIKGSHAAIKTGMLAVDAAFDAVQVGRQSDELNAYRVRSSKCGSRRKAAGRITRTCDVETTGPFAPPGERVVNKSTRCDIQRFFVSDFVVWGILRDSVKYVDDCAVTILLQRDDPTFAMPHVAIAARASGCFRREVMDPSAAPMIMVSSRSTTAPRDTGFAYSAADMR